MKIHSEMSDNLIVNVLETTAPELAQVDLTENVWINRLFGFDVPADLMRKRIERKESKALTLQVNGVNSYVLQFAITDQNFLYVQNLVALKPTLNFRALMQWIISTLAPTLKVAAVIWDTKSAAVYRLSRSVGGHAIGVVMMKKI